MSISISLNFNYIPDKVNKNDCLDLFYQKHDCK